MMKTHFFFYRKWWMTVLLLSCLSLLFLSDVAIVHAEEGTDNEFKGHIHRAVEQYKSGEWQGALSSFKKAHAIRPNARTLRGMGLCAFMGKRYIDAVRWLSKSLAYKDKPLPESMREETERILEDAKDALGTFSLDLNPADAEVTVDGRKAFIKGDQLKAEPGKRTLLVKADAHQTYEREIDVVSGDNGDLKIVLEPEGAEGAVAGDPFDDDESEAEESEEEEEEPSEEMAEAEDDDGSSPKVVEWILIGIGAGMAIAGGVMLGLMANDYNTVINGEGTGKELDDAKDRVELYSAVGISLAAAGFVTAGVGIYLLTLGDDEDSQYAGAHRKVGLQLGFNHIRLQGEF